MDFACLKLPGQPMVMHMGTSYLVNDLAAEVRKLRGTNGEILAALQAVAAEVSPDQRPYSTDSYLPQHIVDLVTAAIDKAEGRA